MVGVRGFKGGWKRITKNCTHWAFYITAIWLVGAALYVGFNWCKFLKMDPNALGDFLAGTFSPLALFWLVAGYMQQGKALRLNTHEIKLQRRALLLQHKELAAQVKATLDVATHAKQQAAASLEMAEHSKFEINEKQRLASLAMQPKFKFEIQPTVVPLERNVKVSNDGYDAREVKCITDAFSFWIAPFSSHFTNERSVTITFTNRRPNFDSSEFVFALEYTDLSNVRRVSKFRVTHKSVVELQHAMPVPDSTES